MENTPRVKSNNDLQKHFPFVLVKIFWGLKSEYQSVTDVTIKSRFFYLCFPFDRLKYMGNHRKMTNLYLGDIERKCEGCGFEIDSEVMSVT